MNEAIDRTRLRRQLLTLALYAAMPFLIALGPVGVRPDAAIDWQRLLPLLAPTIGGFVLTGCLVLFFLPTIVTRAGRVVWCAAWAFASPMVATIFAVLLYLALTLASLGRFTDPGSLIWVMTILPMLMLQAPLVYALGALALAVATAAMLATLPDSDERGPSTAEVAR